MIKVICTRCKKHRKLGINAIILKHAIVCDQCANVKRHKDGTIKTIDGKK